MSCPGHMMFKSLIGQVTPPRLHGARVLAFLRSQARTNAASSQSCCRARDAHMPLLSKDNHRPHHWTQWHALSGRRLCVRRRPRPRATSRIVCTVHARMRLRACVPLTCRAEYAHAPCAPLHPCARSGATGAGCAYRERAGLLHMQQALGRQHGRLRQPRLHHRVVPL